MTIKVGIDSLLASPIFIGGASFVMLVAGIIFGYILAKRKIKKGIELYKDI